MVSTANENWRGKNDPTERRRIQNRLNQRAFRQRQRDGESPKQYKPRTASLSSQQDDSEDDDEDDSPQPEPSRASSARYSETEKECDELAQLINRNFMAAALANAQHIGIDGRALQAGTALKTPRIANRQIPAALVPVEPQYQMAHDPVIDTIPHPRLRYNIMRAIATRQLDANEFSKSIRSSGALQDVNGSRQRGGVVVWSSPEQVASWELSEAFVRKWTFLLSGCEDLIAATNAWRGKRGERLFPVSFER